MSAQHKFELATKAPGLNENLKARETHTSVDNSFQCLPTKQDQNGFLVDPVNINNANSDIVYIIPKDKVIYLHFKMDSMTILQIFQNETGLEKDNKLVYHQYNETELDEKLIDNNKENSSKSSNDENVNKNNNFPFYLLKVYPIVKFESNSTNVNSNCNNDNSLADNGKVKVSKLNWKKNMKQKFASFVTDDSLKRKESKLAVAGSLLFEKQIHYTTEAQLTLNGLKDIYSTFNVSTKRSKLSSSSSMSRKGATSKSAAKRVKTED
eukprot:Awhi_evm2s14885